MREHLLGYVAGAIEETEPGPIRKRRCAPLSKAGLFLD